MISYDAFFEELEKVAWEDTGDKLSDGTNKKFDKKRWQMAKTSSVHDSIKKYASMVKYTKPKRM